MDKMEKLRYNSWHRKAKIHWRKTEESKGKEQWNRQYLISIDG